MKPLTHASDEAVAEAGTHSLLSMFLVAEKTSGSRFALAPLRWALVLVFLWFGCMKFTTYEANGISPFIVHSPYMAWLNAAFGTRGASDVIGVLELATAVALAGGAFNGVASALGAAMSCITYLCTIGFIFTTPGVTEQTAGGFPAISAAPGQFLLKDTVLLAASVTLLLSSLRIVRKDGAGMHVPLVL